MTLIKGNDDISSFLVLCPLIIRIAAGTGDLQEETDCKTAKNLILTCL